MTKFNIAVPFIPRALEGVGLKMDMTSEWANPNLLQDSLTTHCTY